MYWATVALYQKAYDGGVVLFLKNPRIGYER